MARTGLVCLGQSQHNCSIAAICVSVTRLKHEFSGPLHELCLSTKHTQPTLTIKLLLDEMQRCRSRRGAEATALPSKKTEVRASFRLQN